MQKAEAMASVVTQTGAAVASGSFLMSYLNHNSSAILAICGMLGVCISLVGLAVQWRYFKNKR